MGTYRSATWIVLFALLVSVSSGFGITFQSLDAASSAGESTVCDAQATINRMLSGPTDPGKTTQTVCTLQQALGESTDGDETDRDALADPIPTVFAAQRTLDRDRPATIAVAPVAALNAILPALDDACASVPPVPRWSAPLPSYRYQFLLTPHAPPFHA